MNSQFKVDFAIQNTKRDLTCTVAQFYGEENFRILISFVAPSLFKSTDFYCIYVGLCGQGQILNIALW